MTTPGIFSQATGNRPEPAGPPNDAVGHYPLWELLSPPSSWEAPAVTPLNGARSAMPLSTVARPG